MFAPDKVWAPPDSTRLPLAPPITPENALPNVAFAFVIVRVLLPKLTPAVAVDDPESEAIDAPDVVPEISNTPEPDKATPVELAIEPVPDKNKVPPLIVVPPV